jgi:hypothetical protein
MEEEGPGLGICAHPPPGTHLYLLWDPANPIERDIIRRQNARGWITEMSWEVSAEEAEKMWVRQRRRDRQEEMLRAAEDVV